MQNGKLILVCLVIACGAIAYASYVEALAVASAIEANARIDSAYK